jgi:hypothetical protein
MFIKKLYSIGDPAWIYGINVANDQPVQGTVIAALNFKERGLGDDLYYVIEVPTNIEPLLEVRTWQTISQDERGPVGSLRDLGDNWYLYAKKISQLGSYAPESEEKNPDDPTPEQIHAALEKSHSAINHMPLVLTQDRTAKPRTKPFYKKKRRGPKNSLA